MTGYPWNRGQILSADDLNAAFVNGMSKATVSATPPSPLNNPSGALWWNTVDGQLYVMYHDDDSMQWVSANSIAGPDLSTEATVINVLHHGATGDGTTDDTAAIQGVLNTYAGKAVVFIPSTGSPFMVSGLSLPSGTNLVLHGMLKLRPNSLGPVVVLSHVVNIAISGTGTIDGNGAAQSTHPDSMACLEIDLTANVRVSGITLQNAYWWNLNTTQSNNIVVDGATLLGGGAANEFAAQSSECWLTNCLLDGTNNGDWLFCFYGGVTNSGAIGNTFRNAGAGTTSTPPGVGCLSDSAQSLPCRDIVIADNISHDNGGPGIQVQGAASIHTGIIISNNRTYNNNKIGVGGSAGADYWIGGVTNINITGNQLSTNGSSAGTTFTGIFLNPDVNFVSITANHIFNIGQGTTTGIGIWSFNTNYVYCSGNYFYDNQTTATMAYSLNGNAGTHCAYVGNFCDRPLNLNTQPDTVVANAMGLSAGSWTIGSNGGNFNLHMGVNAAKNTNRLICYMTNSVARWYIGAIGPDETGSNAGSDFAIISASDAGALTQTPIGIKRSSGVVTLSAPLTIASTNLPLNAANDTAASAAGVPLGGMYRNGSVLMIRAV